MATARKFCCISKPLPGFALLILLLAGCASIPAHVPMPPELSAEAVTAGCPTTRYILGGQDGAKLDAIVAAAINTAPPDSGEVSLLAISSGGERGAFAAGVLNGWTERGDRPEFRVVCGVSVGALIAPLAFVGPEMDERLRDAVALHELRVMTLPSPLAHVEIARLSRGDFLAPHLLVLSLRSTPGEQFVVLTTPPFISMDNTFPQPLAAE